MSNLTNEQKAIYALLADNVYWDVRKGFTEVGGTDDFTNSNWTPAPDGWTVLSKYPHCQNSCHPHPNNLNGGKGDNHGTIQCRTQTSNIKQTAIA